MSKLKKRHGFTLIEMLIVVAIIAILIAVSIPMVGSALERSRVAVDQANERSAKGLAMTQYLTERETWLSSGAIHINKKLELYYYIDPISSQAAVGGIVGAGVGFDYGRSRQKPRGDNNAIPEGKGIKITMSENGIIERLDWIDEPTPPAPGG